MRAWSLGLLFLLSSATASAAELESVSTSKKNGIYFVSLSIQVDVPESYARSVLLDPERFMAVNPSTNKVEYLPRRADEYKHFRSTARSCALLFCVTYRNVIQMRIRANRDIELIVDPEKSDFDYGEIIWHTEALGEDSSRLSFHAENRPSFWIPPLVGTAILQTQLADDISETMRNIECNYRGVVPCVVATDGSAEDDEDRF